MHFYELVHPDHNNCFMRKLNIATLFFSLLPLASICQKLDSTDYNIYSSLINVEILNSSKSVAIIKKLRKEETYRLSSVVEAFQSQNKQYLAEVYFETRNENENEKVREIDSVSQRLILQYSKMKSNNAVLHQHFEITPKVVLIRRILKHPKSSNEIIAFWNSFNTKYPNSAGIFSFSPICYSSINPQQYFIIPIKGTALTDMGH